MSRSLIVVAAAAALALTGAGVLADDFAPPWWRDNSDPVGNRSTYQRWEFDTDQLQPIAEAGYVNPPSDPAGMPPRAAIAPLDEWVDVLDGRTGIWPLSGELAIQLQNYSDGPEKKVWVQLTWIPLDPQDPDDVPNISALGTVPNQPPLTADLEFMRHWNAGDGWIHTLALLMFHPNPEFEMINIRGDILVDEVVVDTICPEPATMLLLGLAVPFVLKCRSRS